MFQDKKQGNQPIFSKKIILYKIVFLSINFRLDICISSSNSVIFKTSKEFLCVLSELVNHQSCPTSMFGDFRLPVSMQNIMSGIFPVFLSHRELRDTEIFHLILDAIEDHAASEKRQRIRLQENRTAIH